MRRLALIAGAMLLAGSLHANTSINHAYQVRGDGPARPVQVFDDGQQIFVQLRDVRQVPAALGPNGPIAHRMHGHYMVLPRTNAFVLQLGNSRVDVIANGQRALPAGVVSMTSPVEALDPVPMTSVAAPQTGAPQFGHAGQAHTQMSVPQIGVPADEVMGEISIDGGEAISLNAPSAGVNHSLRVGSSEEDIRAAVARVNGGPVLVQGDGTVSGAEYARRVNRSCEFLGRSCRMTYSGADAGTVSVRSDR